MLIKTFCLAAPPGASGAAVLAGPARTALTAVPGLREVQAFTVLRHIPTDSVPDGQSHSGVTREADRIALVVECRFDNALFAIQASTTPDWAAFMESLQSGRELLFGLDTFSNVPIAPVGQAVDGGFRRWMLLARKTTTQDEFRDAWFGRHADLVRALPGVEGYLQNLVIARQDAAGKGVSYKALPIDGVAQLCFADEAAMNASYASDARLPLRDDGRALLGRITTLLVQGETWR
jgi:hypothetical protein